MRLLPHTEIDDYDNKVLCLHGKRAEFAFSNGNVVGAIIDNGAFYIDGKRNVENTKECIYFLSVVLGLEYKGVI